MKNIKLTENHQSKLLEMCKELFYQYEKIYLGVNDYDDKLDGYIYFTDNTLGEIINIHWFEFCITTLAVRILCKNKSVINSSYSKNYFLQNKIINSDEHIVNYLYKEFKKLK